MNKVVLMGRLTKDPEVKYTQSQNPTAIARFSMAVDRRVKKDGEPTADFINCVAFGKTGEFIEKYFSKGMKMAVTGHIQTGSYDDKDGKKVYTTDVIVDNCEFVEKKDAQGEPKQESFVDIPQGIEDELPFSHPQR